MRTFCKNCIIECWKDDLTGLFNKNGFGENCSLYVDRFSHKTLK